MFEHYLLIRTIKELKLDTRQGEPIENSIAPSVQDSQRKRDELIEREHPQWVRRKDTCGVYNCAGHVWAARRTAIYNTEEWDKIIEHDGYKEIQQEAVQPGDLALYLDESGEALHVGVIISIKLLTKGGQPQPSLLSKWDDSSGEFVHLYSDVHFRNLNIEYNIKYYTDREDWQND